MAKNRLWIVGIIFLALIGGGAFFYLSSQKKQINEVVKKKEYDYTTLIDSWNKKTLDFVEGKKYLLSRENNKEMLEQLEGFISAFYLPEPSSNSKYNDFLDKNSINKRVIFESSMDKDKVIKKLREVTREVSMRPIVKKILMMNDIEIWKKHK